MPSIEFIAEIAFQKKKIAELTAENEKLKVWKGRALELIEAIVADKQPSGGAMPYIAPDYVKIAEELLEEAT